MGSRVRRLVAGPALAALLFVGAATPALAESTNANSNAAPPRSQTSANGKPESSQANENAGGSSGASSESNAQDSSASGGSAKRTSTTRSSTASGKSAGTASTGGCDQTPSGSGGSGANTGGAYDDTCGPFTSGNGKGKGVAKGKPAAGTVGKSDEKNPPGQQPGPSDGNNGYECDGNKGVGRTNPAHTSCRTSAPCVPTTQNSCVEPGCVPTADEDCVPNCVPTAEDDCVFDCVPTVADPCAAPCVPTDLDPCTTPVCIESTTFSCTAVEAAGWAAGGGIKVLGAVFTRGGTLARTGGSVLGLTLTGFVLVVGGAVLARLSRRTRVQS